MANERIQNQVEQIPKNDRNDQRKKILFYTDTPLYGGAERQLYLLIKYLDHNLYEAILVCRKSHHLTNWIDEMSKLPIKIFQIDSKSKHSLKNYFELKKIVQIEKPDLLHAQVWNPMACKFLFLLKKKFEIPLVTTEHDPFPLNKIKTIYKKWANQQTDHIICVSKANQTLLKNIYPDLTNKISVVYNGIENLEQKINSAQRAMIRTQTFQLPVKNQHKVILAVGTLHSRKGFNVLIEAFNQLKNKKHLKLFFAGQGPEEQNLKNLIDRYNLNHQISILGQREDVAELMQSADLFILPSHKEAFGLVILEAMQANLPIIASNVGGIPEILDNNYPYLVEPNNIKNLSEKIEEILKDQNVTHNYQNILTKFSAQKTAKNTEEIYQQILS